MSKIEMIELPAVLSNNELSNSLTAENKTIVSKQPTKQTVKLSPAEQPAEKGKNSSPAEAANLSLVEKSSKNDVNLSPEEVVNLSLPEQAKMSPKNSREPCHFECDLCEETVLTTTKLKSGKHQTVTCLMVFLLGGATCCLCLYPCYREEFHDVMHFCPGCGKKLGTCKAKWEK